VRLFHPALLHLSEHGPGTAPEATHIAGRIALTRKEAELARAALYENQTRAAANPQAINARTQAALNQRA